MDAFVVAAEETEVETNVGADVAVFADEETDEEMNVGTDATVVAAEETEEETNVDVDEDTGTTATTKISESASLPSIEKLEYWTARGEIGSLLFPKRVPRLIE